MWIPPMSVYISLVTHWGFNPNQQNKLWSMSWTNGLASNYKFNIRVLLKLRGLYGHMDGEYPWYSIEDYVLEESAKLIGM